MMRPAPSLSGSTGVSLIKRSDLSGRGIPSARLGNSYLQDCARMAGLLKLMQAALVVGTIILVGLLANFSSTSHRIFATTAEGKLTALPPVSRDLGENVVLLWLMDVINRSMTMGYHDYAMRLQEIRPFFTDRGWESFNRYQRTSSSSIPSLRSRLENDFMVMWPRATKPPQVIRKEVVGGVFTYELRAEISLNQNASQSNGLTGNFTEIVDISVERVGTDINPAGLAIARWRRVQIM